MQSKHGTPASIGIVHLVGIGGIGMSGIAEVMHNLGYQVQGSDMSANANVERLQAMGVKIFASHDAANIDEAGIVVISSAIKGDNPEVKAARRAGLAVVRRAEMLAELMRLKSTITIAGTHGKTTTTSLVATLLDAAGFDPTVINGGIINAYGTNARLGAGDWMVVEADESDGTFVRLPSTLGVITNIDPEHLDFYGDFDGLREAFRSYIANIPFYGAVMMCIDHQEVQALMGRVQDRNMISYGLSAQADVRAVHIRDEAGSTLFDIEVKHRRAAGKENHEGFVLPMAGRHNLQNALAALCIGLELGIDINTMRTALAGFAGVKRRFTHTGDWQGVSIYDDYAHHPVEISAVLESARATASGRVIAVMQPHRYSRLRDLFKDFCRCFNEADSVIVAPVYEAGESPIAGFDAARLADGIREHGHRHVLTIESPDEIAALVRQHAEAGDIVLFLGAGSVSGWAYDLPQQLQEAGS
ncbi:MAG: UDP-N-acetylmuramate--L-alanine ligase [Parvibaculales bacterium]